MNEDYLFDAKGEPDPEVAQLEAVLSQLRWSGRQPQFPLGRTSSWRRRKQLWIVAAAACAVVLLSTAYLTWRLHARTPLTSWELSLAGQSPSAVRAGQIIETGLAGAIMESRSIGRVNIEPDSRLRLLPAMRQDEHRLALDHGTIHAFIWAPPAEFVVDTPAAKAVDLGCRYTLSVSPGGKGFLTVEFGWVAFQWNHIESFIPRGAACVTRVGHGPGTPYFLNAPPAFTKSLAEFDLSGSVHALRSVLATARPHDALTLWHLLERTEGRDRGLVFDRFAELVHLSPAVTRESVLRGDPKSLDAAWDALNLGDTNWWREWKRNW